MNPIANAFGKLNTKIFEIPEEFEWINSKRIKVEELKSHVVVFDFWTYCCINCIHMVPVLRKVEEKYKGKPVVVIGIHSAKFSEESEKKNIEEAVKKYGIRHPIIVDKNMRIWDSYGIDAWPTILIFGPDGKIIFRKAGEAEEKEIEDAIDKALKENNLEQSRGIEYLNEGVEEDSFLRYPGKISIRDDGLMAISDSNHNRILIVDISENQVKKVYGGREGFEDGDEKTCKFNKPQGVVWADDIIYVADTENHAIRAIDFSFDKVYTVAGKGVKGSYPSSGLNSLLNSPWDLAFDGKNIFIGMAGFHQIWKLDLDTKICGPYAGIGYENILDGELERSMFAQPSGIDFDLGSLAVADSESSSIRIISKGYVSTISGKGLFEFGYKDGSVKEALFQHPMGICKRGEKIYVADTYNNAVREIDLKEKVVRSIIAKEGSICKFGDPECDTLGLYEPNDVELFDNKIYIADTNNHLIRYFDLESKVLKTLTFSNQNALP
ncbi:MAG: thioredoxin-like domain-containing protein [Candidatus Micrarchaeaceae archaeon]